MNQYQEKKEKINWKEYEGIGISHMYTRSCIPKIENTGERKPEFRNKKISAKIVLVCWKLKHFKDIKGAYKVPEMSR